VWQLDQFPFREDSVEAANHAIDFLKAVGRGLDKLDFAAMQKAQDKHDAIGALSLAQKALFGSY
jgi:xylose isomerase